MAELVIDLARDLVEAVYEKDTAALDVILSETFPAVSESLKKSSEHWPRDDDVRAEFSGASPLTPLLFNFLKMCNMFNVSRPGKSSIYEGTFSIFQELCATILNGKYGLVLPSSLFWSLVNEIIFVFERAHNTRSSAQIAVFRIDQTIQLLKNIVHSSGVLDELQKEKDFYQKLMESNAVPGRVVLGLFAQIGLVRLFTLIADFREALRATMPLHLNAVNQRCLMLFKPSAYVSLYHHIGVAYLMMRRYHDALRAFTAATSPHAKDKGYTEKTKIAAARLLSMTGVLGGEAVDVATNLPDRISAKIAEDELVMANGNLERFRETFLWNSPKFICPVPRVQSDQEVTGLEGQEQQCRVFMRQVQLQIQNATLRGYFSVYQTLTLNKISTLLNRENVSIAPLIAAKMSSAQLVLRSTDADPLGGSRVCTAVVKFRIESDSVSASERDDKELVTALLKRLWDVKMCHG